MPTYEYVCAKCDHHFDLAQSIRDPALKVCPKELCGMKKWGRGKVKRGITAGAGLIFKGSGFYITDYRSENYKAGAKQDSLAPKGDYKEVKDAKSAAPAKTTGESKSSGDSKPAPAKTESKPARKEK